MTKRLNINSVSVPFLDRYKIQSNISKQAILFVEFWGIFVTLRKMKHY